MNGEQAEMVSSARIQTRAEGAGKLNRETNKPEALCAVINSMDQVTDALEQLLANIQGNPISDRPKEDRPAATLQNLLDYGQDQLNHKRNLQMELISQISQTLFT